MASGRFSAAYKDNDKKETRLESYLQDFFISVSFFTFQFKSSL
ncbi:hypothetical protein NC652_019171 [Populus alba x Populus x berolinensis]|nr:hypothetical protein NC652_019171 [Populus alba x Populus x berolinensis]